MTQKVVFSVYHFFLCSFIALVGFGHAVGDDAKPLHKASTNKDKQHHQRHSIKSHSEMEEENAVNSNSIELGSKASMTKPLLRDEKSKKHRNTKESQDEIDSRASLEEIQLHSDGSSNDAETTKNTATSTAHLIRKESSVQKQKQESSAGMDLFQEELFTDSDVLDEADLSDLSSKSTWWDRRRREPCSWHGWTAWTSCPVTCGTGGISRSRGRNEAKHGGAACAASDPWVLHSTCTLSVCPVDCAWSSWTGWTGCPVTCGTGKKSMTRTKLSNAANGGRVCDDPNLDYQESACNTHSCPIDCQWEGWGAWTPCTASCGGGSITRARDKVHELYAGGASCPGGATETQACQTHPCPIDCEVQEWTEWGNCTEDCGGGERTRNKEILIPDQHGGAPCPPTEENGTCNDDACPIKAGARTYSEIHTLAMLSLVVVTMQRYESDS